MFGTVVDLVAQRGIETKISVFPLLKSVPASPIECPEPQEAALEETSSDVDSGQFSIMLPKEPGRIKIRYCAGGYASRFYSQIVSHGQRIFPDPIRMLSLTTTSSQNGRSETLLALKRVIEDTHAELTSWREADPKTFDSALTTSVARPAVTLLLNLTPAEASGSPAAGNRITEIIANAAADLKYIESVTPFYVTGVANLAAREREILSLILSVQLARVGSPSSLTQSDVSGASPTNANRLIKLSGCVKSGQIGTFELATGKKDKSVGVSDGFSSPGAASTQSPTQDAMARAGARSVKLLAASDVNFAPHLNHQVEVAGFWQASGASQAAGDATNASKTFVVTGIRMISATCTAGTS
jgi:hypothetical protein